MGKIFERKVLWITAGAAVIQNWRNGGGFTLIELVVYMAIMGFIIVVAGRVFSDSTKMRVRSQNMLASAEEAGKVSAILKEDISQMGAKSWEVPSSSASSFMVAEKVYYSSGDNSSYNLTSTGNFDKLEFNKVYYNANGTCRAVLHITWEVDNKILYRKCNTITDSKCPISTSTPLADDECPNEPVIMARDVEMFKFEPSKQGTASSPSSASSDITYNLKNKTGSVLIGENNSLYNFTRATSGNPEHSVVCLATTSTGCSTFQFVAGEEYAIDFNLSVPSPTENYMARFQPVTDHLAIGIRKNDKPIISVSDFLFYPPQDGNDKPVHFEFSVPLDQTDANIYITAALYSEAYNAREGDLIFKNIKVSRKTNEVYHFPSSGSGYNPSGSSKADVKAFRLTLQISKKNEISTNVTVIPVPNNGVTPSGGT